jgi:hypothetical protein
MANEPLQGKRFEEMTEYKNKKEWALLIKRIADEWYPKAKKITLVMNNFNNHSATAYYEIFEMINMALDIKYFSDKNIYSFSHINLRN